MDFYVRGIILSIYIYTQAFEKEGMWKNRYKETKSSENESGGYDIEKTPKGMGIIELPHKWKKFFVERFGQSIIYLHFPFIDKHSKYISKIIVIPNFFTLFT